MDDLLRKASHILCVPNVPYMLCVTESVRAYVTSTASSRV